MLSVSKKELRLNSTVIKLKHVWFAELKFSSFILKSKTSKSYNLINEFITTCLSSPCLSDLHSER